MGMKYFEIRSPRPDFTGRVGGISFADGVARVSFDDTRDDDGAAPADEHRVQVGRSAVLFARRRGYGVVEVDASGKPLDGEGASDSEKTGEPANTSTPTASGTKTRAASARKEN